MITEKRAFTLNGYGAVAALLVLQLLTAGLLVQALAANSIAAVGWALAAALVGFCWHGLFLVAPNQGKILQLFGKYVGTEHATGLRWTNPLI